MRFSLLCHEKKTIITLFMWCCYITVDSAMAAPKNGFCSYKLSFLKKTKIMQIMTKNITIFIYLVFYNREIVKLDHFWHFPWVMQTPFCDAAVAKSTVYVGTHLFRISRVFQLWSSSKPLSFVSWAQIVLSLLVTIIRYSLPLLVSNDHVLESTSNHVMHHGWFCTFNA